MQSGQRISRQCHMLSIKQTGECALGEQSLQQSELSTQVLDLDSLDERDEEGSKKLKAIEDIENLQLFCDDEEKIIKVSPVLETKEQENLVQCLRVNSDVFAWSTADMLWVDLQVIIHKLNVLSKEKPVKQKERRFAPYLVEVVRQELAKLLLARFIREVVTS